MVKDKKVLPHLSSYANDPERIEEQANRMAKEGWILEKFGSLFSTYRRGKAGEYEYRVQVKEARHGPPYLHRRACGVWH